MKKILCILLLLAYGMYGICATHIHTDAADYRAGDRMWFRVYFLDANQYPDTVVQMAVVELIDPEGIVSKRVKIMRFDDIFSGYIDIPSHVDAGQYLVRAYPIGMTPNEIAGEQIIYVHGSLNENSGQDTVVIADKKTDSVTIPIVAMPISVRERGGGYDVCIDTAYLQPSERVLVSAAVTDRYAISRHRQWNIVQSVAYAPDISLLSVFGESGAAISGFVEIPVRRKPVSGAVVNMIIPQTYFCASDTTDAQGRFAFANEMIPDGMTVLLMAYRSDGRQNVILEIEEESFPAYEGTPPAWLQLTDGSPIPLAELSDITDSITLEEIEVTAKRRIQESATETQSRNIADMSFGMNKIEEYSATCLHDLLRRVPGVRVVNDQCFIRGAHSIYASNPAAIAINGVIQEGDYDLDLIPMQDIARLDIFKTGTTAIWGSRGGAGVISIILKDGSEVPQQSDPSNMKRLKPLGWQLPAAFFVQTSSDNTRRPGTVLWDPNVQSPILHFVPVATTIYDIVIEGVTSHGRLIHEKYEIMNTP